MTQQVKHPLTPEAVETPASDPVVPQNIVAQLRAIRASIPDYTQLAPAERQKLVTVAKATDPDFVQATINGVGSSPNAQGAVGKSADELRQETIDIQQWSAVEAEAAALLQGIVTANLVRRYRVGEKALAVYTICRKLSKMKEHADLLPHVETMTRLNRFGRKLKKASEPVPAPAPAPATQTAG